mgnify:CR=1 FL=1
MVYIVALAFDERKTLRFLQGLYDVLLRQRWLYYSGKASDAVYEEEPMEGIPSLQMEAVKDSCITAVYHQKNKLNC